MRRRSVLRYCGVAAAAALSMLSHPTFAQQDQRSLFVDLGEASQQRAGTPLEPHVLRERRVGIDFAALAGPGRGEAARREPALGETIRFDMFPDVSLVAILSRFERHADGRYVWVGHIADQPYNEAILVVHQGVLTAEISDGPRAFSVRPGQGGTHRVLEIDRRRFPSEQMPVQPLGNADLETKDTPIAANDSAGDIRVLVVYTPSARQSAGGTTAIQNLAVLGVAQTNTVLGNTGSGARLTFAGTQEVAYSESSSMGSDLNWLRSSVGTLRNQYAADLVAMLTHGVWDSCGIAWLFGYGSSYGHSVTDYRCVSNLTFPHEIGHNLGAGHDPYVGDGGGYYSDSHGHVHIGSSRAASWQTVMSYNDLCYDWFGNACGTLNLFSNPNIYYAGSPTGIAGRSNNARVIGNTAGTVANYRTGGGGGGGTTAPGAPSGLTYAASATDSESASSPSGLRQIPVQASVFLEANSVTLFWNAPTTGGTPTSYVVEWGSASGLSDRGGGDTGSTATSSGWTNFTSGFAYYGRVRAKNSAGTSVPSNEVTIFFGGGATAPGAPSNLTASASGSTVTISWSAPASGGTPTAYILEVGSSSGGTDILVSNVGLGNPLIAENVQPLTAYLGMRATNSAGTSGRSNEVLLVVGGGGGSCTGPPGVVTGLSFTVSGSTVTLRWNGTGGGNAPTTYFLRAGSGPGLSNLVPNLDLGGANTTLVASSVGSGIYYVRIYPSNNCGVQPIPSNEAIVIVP